MTNTEQTEGWMKVENCKVCGRPPIIIPKGKKKIILCDHGSQKNGVKSYETVEEWNRGQK